MLHSVSLDSSPIQYTSLARMGRFGFPMLDGSRATAPVHVDYDEAIKYNSLVISVSTLLAV